MDFAPGIVPGISRADYDAVFALNQSSIKIIDERHVKAAWRRLRHPDPPSRAMIVGTAFHLMLLEPEKFNEQFVVIPKWDMRTKVGKESRAAWEADNPGWESRYELTVDEMLNLQGLVRQFLEHPVASVMIDNAIHYELGVFWNHPEYGFPCKALVDVVTRYEGRTWVLDLKSTRDVSPQFWSREIANRGYMIQAEWIIQGLNELSPAERDFGFLVGETGGERDVMIYEAGPTTRWEASHRIARACLQWDQAIRSDTFPGAEPRIQMIEAPRWAMTHMNEWEGLVRGDDDAGIADEE